MWRRSVAVDPYDLIRPHPGDTFMINQGNDLSMPPPVLLSLEEAQVDYLCPLCECRMCLFVFACIYLRCLFSFLCAQAWRLPYFIYHLFFTYLFISVFVCLLILFILFIYIQYIMDY